MADVAPVPPRRSTGAWLLIGPPVVVLLLSAVATLADAADAPDPSLRALAIPLTFAALSILGALALLARRRLGWLLAVSIVGWHLAGNLVLWWIGTPDYLALGLVALSAVLITSPEMRRTYAARPGP